MQGNQSHEPGKQQVMHNCNISWPLNSRGKHDAAINKSPPFFLLSLSLFLFSTLLLLDMQKQPLDYSKEPSRHTHQLIIRKDKPFNAEPRLQDLVKHYITPDQFHFIRSHGPVPMHLDAATHFITINTHDNQSHQISVNDLINKFEKHHVMMAMQVPYCKHGSMQPNWMMFLYSVRYVLKQLVLFTGSFMLQVFQGNRRDGLHRVKHTKGASSHYTTNTTHMQHLTKHSLGDLGCSSCGKCSL